MDKKEFKRIRIIYIHYTPLSIVISLQDLPAYGGKLFEDCFAKKKTSHLRGLLIFVSAASRAAGGRSITCDSRPEGGEAGAAPMASAIAAWRARRAQVNIFVCAIPGGVGQGGSRGKGVREHSWRTASGREGEATASIILSESARCRWRSLPPRTLSPGRAWPRTNTQQVP